MANFRRFRPDDVNKFSKCNLDPFTETYELGFYLQYFAKWPSLFQVAEDQDGNIIGYRESFPSIAFLLRCFIFFSFLLLLIQLNPPLPPPKKQDIKLTSVYIPGEDEGRTEDNPPNHSLHNPPPTHPIPFSKKKQSWPN